VCIDESRTYVGPKKNHTSVDEHDGSSIQWQSSHLLLPEKKKVTDKKKADFSNFSRVSCLGKIKQKEK